MSNIDYTELRKNIDIETNRAERVRLCKMIDELYEKLIPSLSGSENILNDTPSAKCILQHLLVVFGYAKDISILQLTSWNNSISGLTRNLLECYASAKKMITLYDTPDYEDYICNLVVLDMEQDRKIYNALLADTTIADESKRQSDANSYIVRFENLINTYFPHRYADIDPANRIGSILEIVKLQKKEYDAKYAENTDKSTMIATAIKGNTYILDYDGGNILYRLLCHHTHNTLSSLDDRTIRNGIYMMNNATTDLLGCVQLAYYCMLDSYDEFMKILDLLKLEESKNG